MRSIALAGVAAFLGFLTPLASSAQQTETYTYDAQGRLTTATATSGSSVAYQTNLSYDAAGNRTCYASSVGSATTQCSSTSSGGGTGSGWSSTLTAGSGTQCYSSCITYTGYSVTIPAGSLSVTTFNGNTITQLYSTGSAIVFMESGSSAPAISGWTQINVPGVGALQRATASYLMIGQYSMWSWPSTATVASGTVTIQ